MRELSLMFLLLKFCVLFCYVLVVVVVVVFVALLSPAPVFALAMAIEWPNFVKCCLSSRLSREKRQPQ